MSGRPSLRAAAPLLAAGLLALLAGCRSTSTCKEGTILLTVDLGAGAGPTTRLSVRVTSGGDLLSSGEIDRPPGQSRGTIEIGFAGRYPGEQMVLVEVSARTAGGTLATRTVSMRLEPGCSTLLVDLLAAGADAGDAGPEPTADGPPDRPDASSDGGAPPPDAPADRSPEASPDLAPVPDAGPDAAPDALPDAAGDLAPDATMGERRVFATSSRHTGNLGGLAGAHAICQQLATSAGLTGTYRAWLSDALSGPASTMVHSSVPYVLVSGERIADNWADLTDGSIRHAIDRDERGLPLDPEPLVCEGGEVWTNTTASGTSSGLSDCLGWRATGATSNNGSMKEKNGRWTDDTCDNTSCLTDLPLYCFEQ